MIPAAVLSQLPVTATPVVPLAKTFDRPSTDSAQRPKFRSVAFPVTWTRPLTWALVAGKVIDTEGAVVSMTVTVELATVTFPAESVAVKWTVVAPSEKKEGASFVRVTLSPMGEVALAPLRKVWIAAVEAGAPPAAFDSTRTGAGTVTTGADVVWIRRYETALIALPVWSVAVKRIVANPIGKYWLGWSVVAHGSGALPMHRPQVTIGLGS